MGRKKLDQLTADDEKALAFIREHVARHGERPPVRAVGLHLGLNTPSNAKVNIGRLDARGLIPDPVPLARPIRMSYLGPVAAGEPVAGVEPLDETFDLPAPLGVPGAVVYRVRGDSMLGDHIADGDYAVVRPQETADGARIVVVRAGDGLALKRVRRQGRGVYLVSSNPDAAPIRLTPGMEPHVVGALVNTFRLGVK